MYPMKEKNKEKILYYLRIFLIRMKDNLEEA